MAAIFRHQGSSIAHVLLLPVLFLVFVSPAALAQLYEQPVLIIDTFMHAATISEVGADTAGRIAVTGSFDKTLKVWSLPDGQLLRTIRMPAGPGNIGKIYTVAVHPDGALVAAGVWTADSGRESIYVFQTLTGKIAARFSGLPGNAVSLAFSPDGRYLAAGLAIGGLRVYDREQQWGEVFRDANYRDGINGVTFSADGWLGTTSGDGQVRLYDRAFTPAVPPKPVTSGKQPVGIAFSPDGTFLAVGYNDVPAVELLDGHTLAQLPGPNVDGLNNGSLSKVAWSKDGRTLYAGGRYADGDINPVLSWANAGRGERREFRMNVSAVVGSLGAVVGLTSLPDGGLVVAAHDPPLMRLNREGKYIWVNTSSKLDFRDPQLAVSEDGTIVDFRARGMPRLRFDLTARRLSVDPPADRQTISTNQSGLAIENWKNDFFPTVDGEPITLDPDESSRSLAIYPDNGRFVLGADRSLRAFEARGQPIWRHVAPSVVWAVNISGNGRLAIAAYDDGTIRWHRMDDGRELLALYVFPGGRQEWVAWTPEGFYDATADVFGRLQWQVNRDFGSEVSTIPVNAIARLRRPDVLALVLQELETAHVVGIPELKAARRDVQIATGSKSPPGPRLHVLTIGISAYGDKAQNLSLKFASRDAQDVANAILNTQSDGLYAEIKPMFLHDDEADKGGIYDALAAMDRNMMGGAGQDLAVILFSGHGTMIDNRFYLLPYGADSRTSARLKASAIPATELKSEIEKLAQQGRVLVLLDACRSAGLIGGPSNTAPAADMLKSVMNAGNVTVLTSSTADRVSHEDEKWGHGAFTKTFLDALSPSDDVDPNHDGVISMSELPPISINT